jgi:hypothetical protein
MAEPPWYQRPLAVSLIGILVGAIITVLVTQVTQEKPIKPTSENATVTMESLDDSTIQVSGVGWAGDNAVELTVSIYGTEKAVYPEVLVRNGEFTWQSNVQERLDLGAPLSDKIVEVIVVGQQTGINKRESVRVE